MVSLLQALKDSINLGDQEAQKFKKYVEEVLEVHKEMRRIIKQCFQANKMVISALQEAIKDSINDPLVNIS